MSARASVITTFVVVSLLAALATLAPSSVGAALEYRRDLVPQEWWRVVTAALVHTGWRHLLLDLAGLWLIAAIFLRYFSLAWLLASLPLLSVGISLGLFAVQADVEWYRGLSGMLHGLLVWGLLRMLPDAKWPAALALSAIALKLVADGFTMPRNEWIGAAVVNAAHVWGTLGGLVLYLAWLLLRGSRAARDQQRNE